MQSIENVTLDNIQQSTQKLKLINKNKTYEGGLLLHAGLSY
jgi:hypothetical protein